MKRTVRKIFGLCLTIIAGTSSFTINTRTIQAKTIMANTLTKKNTVTLYRSGYLNNYGFRLSSSAIPKDATSVSISSSNKKTAVVNYNKGLSQQHHYCCMSLSAKKAGTTTIRVSAKKNGRRYRYTASLKVVNYKNPASSIKVGSKNVGQNYNTQLSYAYSEKKKSLMLQVKASKGWKIKHLKYSYYVGKKKKSKTVKNNRKLTRYSAKDKGRLLVTFYHSSSKNNFTSLAVNNKNKGCEILSLVFR